VTAPVFVVDPAALQGASIGVPVVLDGPEGRHAVTVRRLTVGESVDLVDGAGRRVSGHVSAVLGKNRLEVEVEAVADESAFEPRLVVVQALAKGDRGELAVELLTEVGVDEIVPWSAVNCVTRWRDDRARKAWQRWDDAARAAAKQSRRARFPLVSELVSTGDLVARVRDATLAVVLDERALMPIADLPVPAKGEVLVVVGPEGGLSEGEAQQLAAAGAHLVRLGPSIMRTSSAGMAACSILLSRSGRWSSPVGPPARGMEG
jgi:16S rRNA (uracil1498-N3)-methyltransferase